MSEDFYNDDEREDDGLDDMSHEDLKKLVGFYQQYSEWLDDTLMRCEDALHDTILRQAGVVPASAEEFFDHDILSQAEVRRKLWQFKAERGLN